MYVYIYIYIHTHIQGARKILTKINTKLTAPSTFVINACICCLYALLIMIIPHHDWMFQLLQPKRLDFGESCNQLSMSNTTIFGVRFE